ncbi:MAG: CPBP family glutamic-type intramembrane protease, partial [Anaerolineales bacterium]
GWLGYGLDRAMNNPPDQQLGTLLWLIAPLSAALLLRALGGDGWVDFGLRPALRGNAAWYAASVLLYPVVAALVVLIGRAFGWITFPDFTFSALLASLAMGLLPAFIKNIFEEFAWRGHLAPGLQALGVSDWANHLGVGVVWAVWHLPYYLFLLDRAVLTAYTSLPMWAFLLMTFVGILALALVYGELRLLTNSVWPAVLLHTVSGALAYPLAVDGFVQIAPRMDWLISPGPHSLLSILASILIGCGLYWLRTRRVQA